MTAALNFIELVIDSRCDIAFNFIYRKIGEIELVPILKRPVDTEIVLYRVEPGTTEVEV